MIDNLECIENFESIFEDVRFTSNSYVRLKVLAALFRKSQNMKEITDSTHLSYSSVSSNMHDLEIKGFVYREHNKYHLTNSARIRVRNILEFNRILLLLDEFFNILDGHIVDIIPNESVIELYLLGKANLMESSGVDAYRTYNFIERSLSEAEEVKCVFPFYYEPFFSILERLMTENKDVELLISENFSDKFDEDSIIRDFETFDEKNVFLLIVTDKSMILGLFMENGFYDQNRLLTSRNEDSIRWAKDLFENFKKRNK